MNGVLITNKPAGLTSHDVVNRVRRILQERSVGHLGTLDPMATGVLPIVVGNLTRLAQFYTGAEKMYEGTIRFGFATDTYDVTGEMVGEKQAITISLHELRTLVANFVGVIEQTPPPYSAKKIDGVRAYKLARKSREVLLPSVRVEIKELEMINAENDRVTFRARVASGTYMRSIAHDMGRQMGCGAHLASLCRTSVAEFKLADACTLQQLQTAADGSALEEIFVHPRQLLPDMPGVTVNEELATKIRNGLAVNLPELSQARLVKVYAGQRELIAIATRVAGALFHAKTVFGGSPEAVGANKYR